MGQGEQVAARCLLPGKSGGQETMSTGEKSAAAASNSDGRAQLFLRRQFAGSWFQFCCGFEGARVLHSRRR